MPQRVLPKAERNRAGFNHRREMALGEIGPIRTCAATSGLSSWDFNEALDTQTHTCSIRLGGECLGREYLPRQTTLGKPRAAIDT